MLKTLLKSLVPGARKQSLEQAAQAADAAGELRDAIARRRELAELEPHSADRWLALAKTLRRAGEPREAAAVYQKALQWGAPAADVHLQLGVLHADLSEHAAAIQNLEKAIELAPGNADMLCMLGTVMSDQRRVDEAAALFERALAIRPDFSEAHFNLGLAKFERADFQGAARCFARCVALNRGEPWSAGRRADLALDPGPRFEPQDMAVNNVKLRHDCEQLEYLLELGRLPASYRKVLADYRSLLQEIGTVAVDSVVPFDSVRHPYVARTYKRPLHIAEVEPPQGPLINPELDFRGIEQRYLQAEPNVIAVDALLTPPALQALRRFCAESTIWNNIKPGYLGAYFWDGFCSGLLLRLAWELRQAFPAVFRRLPLQAMWGYKCDSTLPGLGVHADAAAVNVNFWITDDSANLDPQRGGLLVYPQAAPQDWGFKKFNSDSATILRYLESTVGTPLSVPYRANRAVIFDSDLFHATDRPRFREGYLNRRINITLLYGLRSM
jgi:tetratricopeptide (TPR) repeat protein